MQNIIFSLIFYITGTTQIYRELETKVAKYLGVEDSVVIGMGFATNSLSLPCLFGPGSLVISDECNHASLALGCKISGAKILVFKHNSKLMMLRKLVFFINYYHFVFIRYEPFGKDNH